MPDLVAVLTFSGCEPLVGAKVEFKLDLLKTVRQPQAGLGELEVVVLLIECARANLGACLC